MYYIIFAIFYLLSLLPWRVIYIFSDFCYLLVYYVFGYRRKIVRSNLKIAFPNKSEAEIIAIEKEFYKSFCDNFIEIIKFVTVTREEMDKRFKGEPEKINDLIEQGYKVQVHSGHFFSWEFCNMGYSPNLKYPFLTVYMPITNKIFERLFLYIRERFGTKMLSAPDFKTAFSPYRKQNYCLVLIADQNPPGASVGFWTEFFGKKIPFAKGPEKGAQFNNTAILMANMIRVKRGYYKSELELLTKDPRSLPEGEITKKMVSYIENTIRRYPSNYLWSHRRFKWEYIEEEHRKYSI